MTAMSKQNIQRLLLVEEKRENVAFFTNWSMKPYIIFALILFIYLFIYLVGCPLSSDYGTADEN